MISLIEKIKDPSDTSKEEKTELWDKIANITHESPDFGGFDIFGDNTKEFIREFFRVYNIYMSSDKSKVCVLADFAHLGLLAHLYARRYNLKVVEVAAEYGVPSVFAAKFGQNDVWITDRRAEPLEQTHVFAEIGGVESLIHTAKLDVRQLDEFLEEKGIDNPLIMASQPFDHTTGNYDPFLEAVAKGQYIFLLRPHNVSIHLLDSLDKWRKKHQYSSTQNIRIGPKGYDNEARIYVPPGLLPLYSPLR